HLQRRGLRNGPLAATARAGVPDDPLSLTAGTRRAEQAAHAHLARASALRTGLRAGAGSGAAPFALRASGRTVHDDFALGAEHRIAQIHLDRGFGVVAHRGLRRAAPCSRRAALAPAEEVFEHRSEIGGIESCAAGEAFENLEYLAEAAGAGRALELARLRPVQPGPERDAAGLVRSVRLR